MKHIQRISLLLVLVLASCGQRSAQFGEDFAAAWQEGGVAITWETDIGLVTKGQSMQRVGDNLCVANSTGDIYLLEMTSGQQVNQERLGFNVKASGACTGRKIALILTSNQLLVIDPRDGSEAWSSKLGSTLLGSPILVGNTLLLLQANGEVIAYSLLAGEQLWTLELPASTFRFAGSFKAQHQDNNLYFGMPEGTLYSIDTINGFVSWDARLFDTRDPDPTANITQIAGPAVTAELACAVAFKGNLACFSVNTGALTWEENVSSASTVVSDGQHVFLVDDHGSLVAHVLAEGEQVWQADGASSNRSPFIIHNQGQVWVDNGFAGVSVYSTATGALSGGLRLQGEIVDAIPLANDLVVLTTAGKIYRLTLQ